MGRLKDNVSRKGNGAREPLRCHHSKSMWCFRGSFTTHPKRKPMSLHMQTGRTPAGEKHQRPPCQDIDSDNPLGSRAAVQTGGTPFIGSRSQPGTGHQRVGIPRGWLEDITSQRAVDNAPRQATSKRMSVMVTPPKR
jgi:hypothetical protein